MAMATTMTSYGDGDDEMSCGGGNGNNGDGGYGYNDDELQRRLGFRFFCDFYFFWIFILACGRRNHPARENAISACGCVTCTQKSRFSQTSGCVPTAHPHVKILFHRLGKSFS